MKKSPENDLILREKALACKPVRHSGVTEKKTASGEIIISYPAAVRPWFIRWMQRRQKNKDSVFIKQLQLDSMGASAWKLMDGSTSVQAIISYFIDALQMHPREAELSVTAFVRELGKRGIIGMKE